MAEEQDQESQTPTPTPAAAPTLTKTAAKTGFDKRLLLLIPLVLFTFGSLVFWLRPKASQESEATLTPTETPLLTVQATATPEEPEETPSPVPTATPKPSLTPTATPTPETKSMTITSTADLDGFQSSNGGGNLEKDIRVGRNSVLITRGFVSFALADLPEDAVIESASLRLYQAKIIGDPYDTGLRVQVDHLDYGSDLTNTDYSLASLSSNFANLSDNETLEWKGVWVTDQLKNDLDNDREHSQYRIHFATEDIGGTATGDFAYFESANDSEGTGNLPQLVINYH